MICVKNNFIKDLDDIVRDPYATSDELKYQICHVKCRIKKLVCRQILRLKNGKDHLNSQCCQSVVNSFKNDQIDASTEPYMDYNLPDETTIQVDASTNPLSNLHNNNVSNVSTTGNDQQFDESTALASQVFLRRAKPNEQTRTFLTEGQTSSRVFETTRPLQFARRSKKIISALLIGFVVWIALVYGALLGASMCEDGYCFLRPSRRPTVF